jgi:hypothetical protein
MSGERVEGQTLLGFSRPPEGQFRSACIFLPKAQAKAMILRYRSRMVCHSTQFRRLPLRLDARLIGSRRA